MRACVVGCGLAGSLLAWRLTRMASTWRVDLIAGDRRRVDATAASGGSVRAYEPDGALRELAVASLVELLASRTLQRWARYRPVEFVYLAERPGGLDSAVKELDVALPGSADLLTGTDLRARGWAGLPDEAVAVRERHAGYTSPEHLRRSVLADAGDRLSTVESWVSTVSPTASGTVVCSGTGLRREYDVVVIATGAWTGALLAASGLPAAGYRTKSIQYSIYPVAGWRPPQFVDEATGLYGRPAGDSELLLGLATRLWDVDPDAPPTTPALHDQAARLARERFPRLRIGSATATVGSSDCYTEQPTLSLRAVLDGEPRLFTFTGGSGGSVKTALAASHRAAIELVESGQSTTPRWDAGKVNHDR